jgi:hypothetical protein
LEEATAASPLPAFTLPSMGKQSFIAADALPDPSSNDFWHEEPVFTQNLPGVSMERLEQLLRAEPFIMETCLKQDIKAFEMKTSRWQEGVNAPGTFIRSMKYKMPVPEDIPSAVRSVVAIPKFCSCKTFVRLHCKPEELDLTFQTLTDGLPLGENVQLQVTNTFTPYSDSSGAGVTMRRWIVVAWVKELLWTMRFLKGIVVSQIMQAGRASAHILAELVCESTTAAAAT